jgi:predicted ATP-grasp superfamily ATP-dependent carboligase
VRVFVYEHITGGGCAGGPLPEALLAEASAMARALVEDLADIPGISVIGLRDHRLAACSPRAQWTEVRSASQWQERIEHAIRGSDATWPIAPETAGALEAISQRVLSAGRRLVGSRPQAVRVAASKLATARCLERAGVPVVPTFSLEALPASAEDPWIAKPDDGCGCEDVRWFAELGAALRWMKSRGGRPFVLQPYTPGEALSLSAVALDGKVALLSVNRQRVALHDGALSYQGSVVNAVADLDGRFQRLAQEVAAAIPGLWGYFGVDLILSRGEPLVVDVNPRLTTSYAGLRESRGINAAAMVLGAASGDDSGGHDPNGACARGSTDRVLCR